MGFILNDYMPLDSVLGFDQPAITPSGFFPSAQKTSPISSQISLPAFTANVPRTVAPEAPSIAQTAAWAYNNWFTSPYEAQFAPSKAPIATTAPPVTKWDTAVSRMVDPWAKTADSFFKASGQALLETWDQLPNLLLRKAGLIPEVQTVNTQGAQELHVYQTESKYPQPAISEQPTGLFNLGYLTGKQAAAAQGAQPAAVQAAAAGGTGGLLIVGFILLLLMSKK